MSEKPQLDRFGVAAALQEIAQLLELKGGQNRFKAKAYNAGARAIQAVADLDRLVRPDTRNRLSMVRRYSRSAAQLHRAADHFFGIPGARRCPVAPASLFSTGRQAPMPPSIVCIAPVMKPPSGPAR